MSVERAVSVDVIEFRYGDQSIGFTLRHITSIRSSAIGCSLTVDSALYFEPVVHSSKPCFTVLPRC
jgi:hypothetical protein